MTGDDITRALLRERYPRNFCLPRYTPTGWWECDVFEVTKAGYFREYEIKISLADYRADNQKVKDGSLWHERRGQKPRFKHQEIRSPKGPTQFWYVAPAGLLSAEIVPEWAGLIEIIDRGEGWTRRYRYIERELKSAPRLHRTALDPTVEQHARGVCYWRLLGLLTKRNDYAIPTETTESPLVPDEVRTEPAEENGETDPPDEPPARETEPPVRPRIQRVEGWPRVRV